MFWKETIGKWPKKERQNYFKDQTTAAHLHKVCKHHIMGYFSTPFTGAPDKQFGKGLSSVSPVQI